MQDTTTRIHGHESRVRPPTTTNGRSWHSSAAATTGRNISECSSIRDPLLPEVDAGSNLRGRVSLDLFGLVQELIPLTCRPAFVIHSASHCVLLKKMERAFDGGTSWVFNENEVRILASLLKFGRQKPAPSSSTIHSVKLNGLQKPETR